MTRLQSLKTIDRDSYNCGGYALDTFEWEFPYDYDNSAEYAYYNMDERGYLKDIPRQLNFLVNRMRGKLRLIKDEKNLLPNEQLILYRTGMTDFHFVKKGKNGIYYHKRGASSKICRMLKEDVYDKRGWKNSYGVYYYISPIFMFALSE